MPPEKIVLRFGPETADKPIVYRLVKDYGLLVNIVRASINPDREGSMVLELTGERYPEGVDFLRAQGVSVSPLASELTWDEEKCTHCGACTVHCPTNALAMDRPAMTVRFSGADCLVCLMCIDVCPVRAMATGI